VRAEVISERLVRRSMLHRRFRPGGDPSASAARL